MIVDIKKNPHRGELPGHWLVRVNQTVVGRIVRNPASPLGDCILLPEYVRTSQVRRNPSDWGSPQEALDMLLRNHVNDLKTVEDMCDDWDEDAENVRYDTDEFSDWVDLLIKEEKERGAA